MTLRENIITLANLGNKIYIYIYIYISVITKHTKVYFNKNHALKKGYTCIRDVN